MINKFKTRGTVENQNAGPSGISRTTRTGENIDAGEATIANPTLSARRNGLGIPRSTFNEITLHDLNYHPYRICVRHELKAPDYGRRMNYSRWLLEMFGEVNFIEKVVISDDAAFCMNGAVNTHNTRSYAPRGQHPNFTYDMPSSREKVTVWAGLCGNSSILGPFFFYESVNGERYLNMINESVVPDMDMIFNQNIFADVRYEREVWWFQDGAPCHRLRLVTTRLEELFGDQVVALNRPTEWPPRSPDLTPYDFFQWGHLKDKVYKTPSADVFTFQHRIIDEFEILRQDRKLVQSAVQSMEKFKDLLFSCKLAFFSPVLPRFFF